MLPFRISSPAVSIPVVPHLRHCARPPLYSPLTSSDILIILRIHCASIVVLPRLCCGPRRIIYHRSVLLRCRRLSTFLQSYLLLLPLRFVLYYTARSALLRATFLALSALIFSRYAFLFSLLDLLYSLSLRDVLAPLLSSAFFFSAFLHSDML